MKAISITFIFFLLMNFGFAQVDAEKKAINTQTVNPCGNESFTVVRLQPEFKGGLDKLSTSLTKRVKPDSKIQGSVYLKFVVNCKGMALDFKIDRGLNNDLNKKLITALEDLQKWEPGYTNVAVNTLMSMQFDIENGQIKAIKLNP
jgi:hypothetical protein